MTGSIVVQIIAYCWHGG